VIMILSSGSVVSEYWCEYQKTKKYFVNKYKNLINKYLFTYS
jgi:hypothetical protein